MYKPDICFYHAKCLDGFGAAYSIWTKWPDIEFVPMSYGDPLLNERVRDKNILFVDFSLEANHIDILPFNTCVILDHHKSAEKELEGFTTFDGSAQDLEIKISERADHNTGVYVHFDMEHSGAYLAWKFTNPDTEVPMALLYIEDRDIWKWEHSFTKAFTIAADLENKSFKYWHEEIVTGTGTKNLIERGKALIDYETKLVKRIADNAYWDTFANYTVIHVNSSVLQSEVGNYLIINNPDTPFVAVWYESPDGDYRYSLRSEDGRVDVSEIAKSLGGGGHKNASGVSIKKE